MRACSLNKSLPRWDFNTRPISGQESVTVPSTPRYPTITTAWFSSSQAGGAQIRFGPPGPPASQNTGSAGFGPLAGMRTTGSAIRRESDLSQFSGTTSVPHSAAYFVLLPTGWNSHASNPLARWLVCLAEPPAWAPWTAATSSTAANNWWRSKDDLFSWLPSFGDHFDCIYDPIKKDHICGSNTSEYVFDIGQIRFLPAFSIAAPAC
jgi:hypothetical protein